MTRRDRRRVAGRVAGWDRTRWLVARQPDFPSRSLARASTRALSPFFRPPFWCPLARSRSLARSPDPRSGLLSSSPCRSTPLRGLSLSFTLPRTLLARPFSPPPPRLAPPASGHVAGTAHRFLRRVSLTRSPSACRRMRRRIHLPRLFLLPRDVAHRERRERNVLDRPFVQQSIVRTRRTWIFNFTVSLETPLNSRPYVGLFVLGLARRDD